MKNKISALIEKKEQRKQEITQLVSSCEDVTQLRALNAEMDTINEEIRSLNEMLASCDDTAARTAAVNSQIPGIVADSGVQRRTSGEDIEYRRAFMDFVCKGMKIPEELRATTLTSDVSAAIPTVVVNRIVETIENVGMILPLITRTNFAAGVNIPTSSVKPAATWVAEGETSDKQKLGLGSVVFTHHKLRCEVAISAETDAMTIEAFEAMFTRQVSEAMVKALEEKIVSDSDGAGSPKGILAETAPEGQAITASAIDYDLLVRAEAAVPEEKETNARWCMSKKTFMSFIGMTDDAGQPIARVNYGIGGKPERTLLGRSVVLAPYVKSFSDSLSAGSVFAFIFDFSDYVLNTVYDMSIQKKQDWDTEDILTKAVMSADGKVVSTQSLVTVAKA